MVFYGIRANCGRLGRKQLKAVRYQRAIFFYLIVKIIDIYIPGLLCIAIGK